MNNSAFIKPHYDAGGFASLPAKVKDALNTGDYDAVVLCFIDCFGWRFFDRFQDGPFLKVLGKYGKAEKITSQFPSTTAAHVTSIHTGLNVGQSGIFEWIYYEPKLDEIIAPLLFSFAGTKERDTLQPTGIDPHSIYPTHTLYQDLQSQGIPSFIFQHLEYTPSTFSDVVFQGGRPRPYKTLPEALTNLGMLLEAQTDPLYAFLYFDRIDAICHQYGPDSPQLEAEILSFLQNMERFFERDFGGGNKRVLFLLTADHGASDTDPQTTIYLNRDSAFDGIERFLKTNRRGRLLVPAGSPRDLFLYIKDELLDDAQGFLAERLAGKAEVLKVQDLISEGYFGPEISDAFRAHIGNLVILPYLHESVWWYEKDKFVQKFYGHHGGLTPEEMEIPLISCELD